MCGLATAKWFFDMGRVGYHSTTYVIFYCHLLSCSYNVLQRENVPFLEDLRPVAIALSDTPIGEQIRSAWKARRWIDFVQARKPMHVSDSGSIYRIFGSLVLDIILDFLGFGNQFVKVEVLSSLLATSRESVTSFGFKGVDCLFLLFPREICNV